MGEPQRLVELLRAFMRLARIEHSVLLAVAVLIGEIVVVGRPPILSSFFGALSVFCIGVGSFTLNDFLDYKTDKKNKRKDRPLITGDISLWAAITAAKVSLPLGVLFALLVNMQCFAIALIFAVFAVLYSYYLKKVMLAGNIFIAFSMAVPFVYGNFIVSSQVDSILFLLVSMAFLTGLGREIIKSIQDMAGDKKYGRRTMPIVAGKKLSSYFAAYYLFLAIVLSPLPFLVMTKFYENWLYMGPVIVTDVILLAAAYYALKLRKLERARKITLLALGIGLAGFLLGALF